MDAACEPCFGGEGPGEFDSYCRSNVPICAGGHTRSICSDCGANNVWTYGITNGNFFAASPNVLVASYCVMESVPGY